MAWKTGRQRTVTVSGSLQGDYAKKIELTSVGDPNDTNGCECDGTITSGWVAFVHFQKAPEHTDPILGRFYGVIVTVFDGVEGTDENEAGEWKVFEEPPVELDWSLAATGSYSMSADVEEWCEDYVIDAVDSQDFPNYGGTAYPDGLPGMGIRFFEKLKPGGTVSAEISFGGAMATASSTIPVDSDQEIGYIEDATLTIDAYREDYPHDFSCSATMSGDLAMLGKTWTLSADNGAVATCETGGGAIDLNVSPGKGSPHAYAHCHAFAQPLSKFEYQGNLRGVGGAYEDMLPIDVRTKESEVATAVARPSCGFGWSQNYYSIDVQLFGSGAPTEFLHEIVAPRSWLDHQGLLSAKEDERDWRLQFQLYPWNVTTVSQASSTAVTGSGTVTTGSPSVSTTESVWEGYRYLTFTATPTGFSNRDLTLTVSGKEYTFHVGSGATSVVIDLRDARNLPGGFTTDSRQSRYPVSNAGPLYGPDTGPPIVSGSDETIGWLWGMLSRPSSVTVSGLSGAESLALSAMSLSRQTSNELRVLLPFMNEVLGWSVEESDTSLTLDVAVLSDGHVVADWPCRAHVVPGTPEYVYYTLSQLQSFFDAMPGWSATSVAENTDGPYDDSGASTVYLLGENFAASNIDGYIFNGTSWRDQTSMALPADVWCCFKADEIKTYPGCGDPTIPYDEQVTSVFPLRVSKILRGQAEGVVYKPDGTAYSTVSVLALDMDGPFAGMGMTQSDGSYRTTAPFGHGDHVHDVCIQAGDYSRNYYGTFCNRYAMRVSYSQATVDCGGTPPRLPIDCVADPMSLPFPVGDTCYVAFQACDCHQTYTVILPVAGGI